MDEQRKIVTSKGKEYEATFVTPPFGGKNRLSFGINSLVRPAELAQELDGLDWLDCYWYSETPTRYMNYTKLVYLDCTEDWRISVILTPENDE